ncbi:MAG: hypothetical protein MI863_16445 [Desulfobacterales bacterium]|nr:hypothetical protein [Desulfobacterales bacterium]
MYRHLKAYESERLIRRAGLGKRKEKLWRLTLEGKRRFDPKAPKSILQPRGSIDSNPNTVKTVRMKLSPGRYGLTRKDLIDQPESRLWEAIIDLKVFLADDLVKLKISSKTAVYQYLALLVRAGFLRKERTNETSNQCRYTLIKKNGPAAPIIGRTWFLFDPNSGKTWDDIPEGEKIQTLLKHKK